MLVLYGTTDGQTRKIAAALAEALRAEGADVDVVRAGAPGADPNPADYAAVVVAAPVRAGAYQRPVRRWVSAHVAALKTRPTAFVSVCLGVLEHNPETDRVLEKIRQTFYAKTGWRPSIEKVVAGALMYRQYNWFTRWAMVRIVRRAKGDTDTSRNHEYTDWKDLEAFGREFYRATFGSTEVRQAG